MATFDLLESLDRLAPEALQGRGERFGRKGGAVALGEAVAAMPDLD